MGAVPQGRSDPQAILLPCSLRPRHSLPDNGQYILGIP
jgi:hypothetical protein